MTGSGMCHHKAISEGTGHSFTKRKGVLMKRHVLKYPLHQPPLRCYSWFDREGEAALLLLIPSVLRAGLGLLDLCERGTIALSAWPDRPSPLALLCSGLTGSGLQHGFIAPHVQKPPLTKDVFSYNAACRHSFFRGRKGLVLGLGPWAGIQKLFCCSTAPQCQACCLLAELPLPICFGTGGGE